MTSPVHLTLESYAARSINYLERMVDADGLPYFNVFWSKPAEAAHDWPDFGDVMSRQYQGAILLRHMTGNKVSTEKRWREKLLSLIHAADGQLYRPALFGAEPVADWGDAALTQYALVTAAIESGDDILRNAAVKMTQGMLSRLRSGSMPDAWCGGFAIKGLMVAARLLGCEAGLEASRLLVDRFVTQGGNFTPDNTFGPRGHMHANLRAMVGAADFALTIGDPVLYSRMDALYRYVKSTGTRFGFLPEVVGRQGDIVACETCALMDFAGIGVTLANHGHPEYWGDMERLARNHYVKSQVQDVSWLESDDSRADTAQFTWRDIGPRVVGAWAGWSSPNHILACRETLHWGGPELRNKTRALQNCCGGSGPHGLFILWKNAARYQSGTLWVNMHLNKQLPQAVIRCEQPYRGVLRIALNSDCAVKVRIPDFAKNAEMCVIVNGVEIRSTAQSSSPDLPLHEGDQRHAPLPAFGNYLELGQFRAGDRIEVQYPLPITTEEIAVGNAGFRQWRYRVTWKGDTVVQMEPLDNEVATAYSDFEEAPVEVFYGKNGPGPLYQREHMRQSIQPSETRLHMDDGALDLW